MWTFQEKEHGEVVASWAPHALRMLLAKANVLISVPIEGQKDPFNSILHKVGDVPEKQSGNEHL